MNIPEIEDKLDDVARVILDCDQFRGVVIIAVDAEGGKAHSYSLGINDDAQREMNDLCDATQAKHVVIN